MLNLTGDGPSTKCCHDNDGDPIIQHWPAPSSDEKAHTTPAAWQECDGSWCSDNCMRNVVVVSQRRLHHREWGKRFLWDV